jgi:hypothetical protein
VRRLLRVGAGAILLVVIMFVGSLGLWVGVPVLSLWVGSQVQAASGDVGTGLGVAAITAFVSIGVLLALLIRLNRQHEDLRAARGLHPQGPTALEAVMATSAVLAVVGFGVWFFFLSGTSPIPFFPGR